MSYSKTIWTNNSAPAINADNLNNIEQGIYDNDAAISSATTNIGTLTNLTTTEKSNLVGAINEVDSITETNTTNIGDLSNLTTTANTDLVSAINEVDAKDEIDNTYGTSQTRGYSQEYQNAHNVVVSPTTPTTDEKVWIQKGKNLFNSKEVVNGYLNISNGSVVASNDWNTTYFIKIPTNIDHITIIGNKGSSEGYCFYNSSRTLISGGSMQSSTSKNIPIPNNTTYFRITVANDVLSSYAIYLDGETTDTYEAYVTPSILVGGDEIYNKDNQEVYSTAETKIGTWIDGKPLYRKVFTGTTNGTGALSISTGSGTYIRTFDGTINSNFNNRWKIPNIYSETQYNVGAFIMTNNYELRLALGSAFQASGLEYVVAIEYTKTTD